MVRIFNLVFVMSQLISTTGCVDQLGGEFALETAYVVIIGDSTQVVTVTYNNIVIKDGETQNENRERTEIVAIPTFFEINLAMNAKTINDKERCYLRVQTDGNTNVRAILLHLSARFAEDSCPIFYAFLAEEMGGGMLECDHHRLGADSLITLLNERGYPCIIELNEGDYEGYVSTSQISNTGVY